MPHRPPHVIQKGGGGGGGCPKRVRSSLSARTVRGPAAHSISPDPDPGHPGAELHCRAHGGDSLPSPITQSSSAPSDVTFPALFPQKTHYYYFHPLLTVHDGSGELSAGGREEPGGGCVSLHRGGECGGEGAPGGRRRPRQQGTDHAMSRSNVPQQCLQSAQRLRILTCNTLLSCIFCLLIGAFCNISAPALLLRIFFAHQ